MNPWFRNNRSLMVSLMLMCLLMAMGVGAFLLWGRSLVEAMYQQRSWEYLNRMIEGRGIHPVEHYHQQANYLVQSLVGFTILTGVLVASGLMRLDGQCLAVTTCRSLLAIGPRWGRAIKAEFCGVNRWHAMALLMMVLLGSFVRLWYVNQPIRFDEAYTATHYAGHAPWKFMVDLYYYPNNHLFHTLLVWFSRSIFGLAPWSVRLPALLAGCLLPIAGYMLARCWYERWTALLTAGLIAGSSILIEFSTNARGYTWLLLLTLAVSWLVAQLRLRQSLGYWCLLVVLSALGFWTMPTMLHPWAILMLWMLLSGLGRDTRRPWRSLIWPWLACCILTACLTLWLYWPILTFSGLKAVTANRFLARLPMPEYVAKIPAHFYELQEQWNRDLPWGVPAIILIGLIAGLVWNLQIARQRIHWLIPALIWLIPINILQRTIYISPRIWLFLLPWYLISASAGLVQMTRWVTCRIGVSRLRWSSPAGVMAITAMSCGLMAGVMIRGSVLQSEETGVFQDAQAVVQALKPVLRQNDRVVCSDTTLVPVVFYFECYGMPPAWRKHEGSETERYWIVVDGNQGETMERVLAYPGGGPTEPINLEQTRLHHRINQTRLYVTHAADMKMNPSPSSILSPQTRSLSE